MGGKKPLRRPLWPPTRATASNYYPLGLDGAGGAAKPLLRAPKKPAPLHGRLPAFSGAVDAFERARKCFLEWRYFFSIILSEFLKNRVALHPPRLTTHSSSVKTSSNSVLNWLTQSPDEPSVQIRTWLFLSSSSNSANEPCILLRQGVEHTAHHFRFRIPRNSTILCRLSVQ